MKKNMHGNGKLFGVLWLNKSNSIYEHNPKVYITETLLPGINTYTQFNPKAVATHTSQLLKFNVNAFNMKRKNTKIPLFWNCIQEEKPYLFYLVNKLLPVKW